MISAPVTATNLAAGDRLAATCSPVGGPCQEPEPVAATHHSDRVARKKSSSDNSNIIIIIIVRLYPPTRWAPRPARSR